MKNKRIYFTDSFKLNFLIKFIKSDECKLIYSIFVFMKDLCAINKCKLENRHRDTSYPYLRVEHLGPPTNVAELDLTLKDGEIICIFHCK